MSKRAHSPFAEERPAKALMVDMQTDVSLLSAITAGDSDRFRSARENSVPTAKCFDVILETWRSLKVDSDPFELGAETNDSSEMVDHHHPEADVDLDLDDWDSSDDENAISAFNNTDPSFTLESNLLTQRLRHARGLVSIFHQLLEIGVYPSLEHSDESTTRFVVVAPFDHVRNDLCFVELLLKHTPRSHCQHHAERLLRLALSENHGALFRLVNDNNYFHEDPLKTSFVTAFYLAGQPCSFVDSSIQDVVFQSHHPNCTKFFYHVGYRMWKGTLRAGARRDVLNQLSVMRFENHCPLIMGLAQDADIELVLSRGVDWGDWLRPVTHSLLPGQACLLFDHCDSDLLLRHMLESIAEEVGEDRTKKPILNSPNLPTYFANYLLPRFVEWKKRPDMVARVVTYVEANQEQVDDLTPFQALVSGLSAEQTQAVEKLRHFLKHADTCAACMDPTLDRLACGHTLHIHPCMMRLPKAVCPLCRAEIVAGKSVTEVDLSKLQESIKRKRQENEARWVREYSILQAAAGNEHVPLHILHDLSQRHN